MDQKLFEDALHTDVLTGQFVDSLKEKLSYSSISFINDTVSVLKTVAKRINRGDRITLEETGGRLDLKAYEKFVKENFSSYIFSETFSPDGKAGKEKIYFQLEACEDGYNLLVAEDGKSKTYQWISSLSEKFSLVFMIATGVVYVKDVRVGSYAPFLSEHGKYCRYDEESGKIIEI